MSASVRMKKEILPAKLRLSIAAFENTHVPLETEDVLWRVKFQTSRIVFTIVGHPYYLTFYRQEQNHE